MFVPAAPDIARSEDIEQSVRLANLCEFISLIASGCIQTGRSEKQTPDVNSFGPGDDSPRDNGFKGRLLF